MVRAGRSMQGLLGLQGGSLIMRLTLVKSGAFWQALGSTGIVYKQSLTKRFVVNYINVYASQNKLQINTK